jgi:hypothetical protein
MKISERIISNAHGTEYYNIFFEIVNGKDITRKQYQEIEYLISKKIKEFNEINNKINRDNE